MSSRREFTRALKAEMLKRAMDGKGQIRCEGCGLNITGKVIEFDHIVAEALVLDKTVPLTSRDGRVLGRDCCHRVPGGKTAQDCSDIAEAKRREARHLGIRRSEQGRRKGFGRQESDLSRSSPSSLVEIDHVIEQGSAPLPKPNALRPNAYDAAP